FDVTTSFMSCFIKSFENYEEWRKCLLTVKPQYNGSEPASGNDCVVPPNATIQIKLELVSWKIVSEVTTDNKVSKNILNEGEEYDHSNDGAVVK
nr:peptidyl-prolyl cis-trans isomerase FKBP62 [Tanacetum cinerariifolium]